MAVNQSQVTEYLRADGYTIVERPTEVTEPIVSAWRSGPAGVRQYINVWMPEIQRGSTFEAQESQYMARFRRARERHPASTNVMLVETRQGLRTSFIREVLNNYRVMVRSPIEFFDTAFSGKATTKWEQSQRGFETKVHDSTEQGSTSHLQHLDHIRMKVTTWSKNSSVGFEMTDAPLAST